jgi:hypothetical protein
MERRQLLKGAMAGSVAGLAASLLSNHVVAGAATVSQSQSEAALAELMASLQELEISFEKPQWRLRTADDFAAARRMLLHALIHALQTWFEADPARPFFVSFVNKHKKMLGDNPDARYHQAAISSSHRYRIFGNVADATYTSFTVEQDSGGLAYTLNDTQFEVDEQGNYEIFASAEKAEGNWLRLPADASSIVTRHYYERELSVQNDQLHCIPLGIENLDEAGPRDRANDAEVAAGIRRVTAFLQRNVVAMDNSNSPAWVSRVPNQFVPPKVDDSNLAISYAAKDNTYAMAPFVLQSNQALVIRGHWPKCRFASVLLHDQFLQSFDYETRTISLNRAQTQLEADGSFKIVVAHKDPGMPNWLDTEGRLFGIMFWRFQLVEGSIEPLTSELIEL